LIYIIMNVPDEFPKLINDFINDIQTAFPEFKPIISKYNTNDNYLNLYIHCNEVYQQHYDKILCRNNEIFDRKNNTEFLPGVSFTYIWHYDDINDNHRDMIWNYLQMIMITVINQDQIREKTSEVKKTLQTLEENLSQHTVGGDETSSFSEDDLKDLVFNNKLADIAKEIADETSQLFDLENMKDVHDINGLMSTLFKNPNTMTSIVKNVSEKLDSKLKTGNINEAELVEEATKMMDKFKNIPGMSNVYDMMNTMQNKNNKKTVDEDKFLNELFDLSRKI